MSIKWELLSIINLTFFMLKGGCQWTPSFNASIGILLNENLLIYKEESIFPTWFYFEAEWNPDFYTYFTFHLGFSQRFRHFRRLIFVLNPIFYKFYTK